MSATKLYKSLAEFQLKCPAVEKNGHNKFLGNKYSTIDDILKVAKTLGDYGLAFTQRVAFDDKTNADFLITQLFHEDGGFTEPSIIRLYFDANHDKKTSTMQRIASAMTYARRIGLSAKATL